MDHVNSTWEKLKLITHDVTLAQEECMIEIGIMTTQSPLPPIHATFFSYEHKRRFAITLWLADEFGKITYPHGKWNWSFQNVYGDIT
jgi:hypothetical protein